MMEPPISIGVISFVAGLVLLIAAVVGQKIEIAAVKMPELIDPKRRALTAMLGAVLIIFGVLQNQPAAGSGAPAAQPSMPAQTSTTTTTSGSATVLPGVLACLANIPAADLQIIPVERDLRTDRKFGSGQPRDGVIALQFTQSGAAIGAVTFRTLSSGLGFRIERVADGTCAPGVPFSSISNPGTPNGAVANYETVEYRFPRATVRMDIAYCEGRDCIALRAQQVGP